MAAHQKLKRLQGSVGQLENVRCEHISEHMRLWMYEQAKRTLALPFALVSLYEPSGSASRSDVRCFLMLR